MSLRGSGLILADEIVVPGSVANLGPGFDTVGVAVQLYLRVRIVDVQEDGGGRLIVRTSRPAVSGENALERAYARAEARLGRGAPTVVVETESEIPLAAGLGSSAAATVAGLRVFERATGPLSEPVALALAAEAEGHADNAAPALVGGLTSVIDTPEGPVALRWPWPEDLALVIATPETGLATARARAALPDTVSRGDAIFNLQRALALVHALSTGETSRLRDAVQDRLHQPARTALVPCLREVLELGDPAVLGAFLSGAGPSIAVLVRGDRAHVERLLASVYARAGVPARVRTLHVHQPSNVMAGAGAAPGRTV